MLRSTIMFLFLTTLLFGEFTSANVPNQSDGAQKRPTYKQAMNHVDKFMALIKKLRAQLDLGQFDTNILLEDLEFDAEKIVNFVEHEIQFEAYQGLLRGATGTLMSRAGNALDQSVLLAKLLHDAGYDARIVQGELSQENALMLVHSMINTEKVKMQSPIKDKEAFTRIYKELIDLSSTEDIDIEPFIEAISSSGFIYDKDVLRESKETAQRLLSLVKKSGHVLGNENIERELVDQSTQYFWVQYRTGINEAWTDTHPVYPSWNAKKSQLSEVGAYLSKEIPENLQHRIKIELFLERKNKSKLEEVPIMAAWERPVANLATKVLTFSNFPNNGDEFIENIAKDEIEDGRNKKIKDAIQKTSIYTPIFNGQIPSGGKAFDLRGNIIDPMAGSNMASALFSNLNKDIGNAIGALDGDDSSVPVTTGQILRITTISPEGRMRKYDRYLFNRLNSEDRKNGVYINLNAGDLFPSPLVDLSMTVTSSKIPKVFVIDLILQQVLNAENLGKWVLNNNYEGDKEYKNYELSDVFSSLDNIVEKVNAFTLLSDMYSPVYEHKNSYLFEPNIISTYSSVETKDEGPLHRNMVDIVENRIRSLSNIEGNIRNDINNSIGIGSWETHSERREKGENIIPIQVEHKDSTYKKYSSADAIDGYSNSDISVVSNLNELDGIIYPIPSNSIGAIRSDIKNGYLVVLPKTEMDNKHYMWWRIDKKSGVSLGRGLDGRGVEAEEELMMLFPATYIGTATGMFVKGMISYLVCAFVSGTSKALANGRALSTKDQKKIAAGCIGSFVVGMLTPMYLAKTVDAAKLATSLSTSFVNALGVVMAGD